MTMVERPVPFRPPIGDADFASIRRAGLTYVDKTQLVVDLLEESSKVVLLPRPRRFGKTTNLSMLRYFLERPRDGQDRSALFSDLVVWRAPSAREHFARYPVIFLSFKDVKPDSWQACQEAIRQLLADLFAQHVWLLAQDVLTPNDRMVFQAVLDRRATDQDLKSALLRLSRLLHQASGQPVVLLLDEYDTPIHAGWLGGYYEEVVGFFRGLLGAVLKDNTSLFRGVLTGILRVARESIFSDLNHVTVHGLLSQRYRSAFGFTEEEVVSLANMAGQSEAMPGIRAWYNGYLFGGLTVYNPWSVMNYLSHPEDGFLPYWANTSSNELLRRLIATGEPGLSMDVELLLRGETIERQIDDNLILRDVDSIPEALWSLMLFSGYLKPVSRSRDAPILAQLAVPNAEVRTIWQSLFRDWLSQRAGGEGVRPLLNAMLRGDEEAFAGRLQELVLRGLSYLDLERRAPERVYHAFVLGMLVHLESDYLVRSNAESGYGRADVLVIPRRPGLPGVVLEFKRLKEQETAEAALASAIGQLRARDYAAALREAGASPQVLWGVVFDGKRLHVRKAE